MCPHPTTPSSIPTKSDWGLPVLCAIQEYLADLPEPLIEYDDEVWLLNDLEGVSC